MKSLGRAAAVLLFGVLVETGAIVAAQEPGRTIEIHAKRFSFSPAEITLKKGETVKLEHFSHRCTPYPANLNQA